MVSKNLSTEITAFFSELALLLENDISCAEALEVIQQAQENSTLSSFLSKMSTDVKQGSSLADSLAKHPTYIEPFLVDVIRAGEQEKRLAETLTEIANYREKLTVSADDLTHRLLFALIYPTVLLFIVLLFSFFMFIFVVPTFADLFSSFGGELPSLTNQIVYLSEVFSTYWWLIAILILVLGWLIVQEYRKNTLFSKLPFFRLFFYKIALIRFLYTYAFALAHHLSPSHALAACAQTADNRIYASLFEKMRADLEAGILLTEIFLKQTFFPQKIKHLVVVSVKTKRADKLFSRLADNYTRQLQRSLEPTLRIFSIFMTVAIGIIIALLVIAMYLPIFRMGEVI